MSYCQCGQAVNRDGKCPTHGEPALNAMPVQEGRTYHQSGETTESAAKGYFDAAAFALKRSRNSNW